MNMLKEIAEFFNKIVKWHKKQVPHSYEKKKQTDQYTVLPGEEGKPGQPGIGGRGGAGGRGGGSFIGISIGGGSGGAGQFIYTICAICDSDIPDSKTYHTLPDGSLICRLCLLEKKII